MQVHDQKRGLNLERVLVRAEWAFRVTLLVVLGVFGGMRSVSAEDELVQRSIDVDAFDTVVATGHLRMEIQQVVDKSGSRVVIDGSSETVEQVQVESVDGVLYLETPEGLRHGVVLATIYLGTVEELIVEGSVELAGDNIRVDKLTIEGRGRGSVDISNLRAKDLVILGMGRPRFNVSGTVVNQVVDLAGVGTYSGAGLASETSQVSVRGAGHVDVWVDDMLDVIISGTARVRYAGEPWVTQRISGRGGVDRL